jgi:PST family polysaccharide transporter
VFTISFEISNLATTELVAPINRAVLPGYAKMAHDLEILQQGFLNVIGLVVLLALPVGFGIAATSESIVSVVLGPQWSNAVPLISILAIFGALNAVQTNCVMVHYATGHPRTVTLIGVIQILFLLPAIIWSASRYGALGIAWAYLANTALIVPLNYAFALYRLELPVTRLLSLFWRPIIATALMFIVVRTWMVGMEPGSVRALASTVGVGAFTYTVALALLWLVSGRNTGPEKTLTERYLVPLWHRLGAVRLL